MEENLLSNSILSNRKRDPNTGRLLSGKKKCEDLLKYSEVREWFNSISKKGTRDLYLFHLDKLLEELKITPKELLDSEHPRKLIINIVNKYKENKPTKARLIKSATIHFFDYNDKDLKFKRQDRIPKKRIKTEKHRKKLEKSEVYALVNATKSLRDKAIILSLYQSGMRIGALLNLRYKHVRKKLFPVEEAKYPIAIEVDSSLDSKIISYDRDFYWTFLAKESCEFLQSYLKEKLPLDDEDPVFSTYEDKKVVLRYNGFFLCFKRIVQNAGMNPKLISPHTLRSSFKKTLSRSGVDSEDVEVMLGHTLLGSSSAYKDYEDMEYFKERYEKADFSPYSEDKVVSRKELDVVKQEAKKQDSEFEKLKDDYEIRIKGLEDTISEFKKGVPYLIIRTEFLGKIGVDILFKRINNQNDLEKALDKIQIDSIDKVLEPYKNIDVDKLPKEFRDVSAKDRGFDVEFYKDLDITRLPKDNPIRETITNIQDACKFLKEQGFEELSKSIPDTRKNKPKA